jgi:hypothetical protein
MRKKGGPDFKCLWYIRVQSFAMNEFAKWTFACPRLKNDFPSFLSSTNNKYLLTKFKFILDDTSNFPPLVPIQEVSQTYFVSRYFIGRKDFRNFFSLLQSRTRYTKQNEKIYINHLSPLQSCRSIILSISVFNHIVWSSRIPLTAVLLISVGEADLQYVK